jgi:hypothetical protein
MICPCCDNDKTIKNGKNMAYQSANIIFVTPPETIVKLDQKEAKPPMEILPKERK